jgi:hypothetical protein
LLGSGGNRQKKLSISTLAIRRSSEAPICLVH